MAIDRLRRRLELLLDEAEEAITQLDWRVVHDRAQAVLAIDPDNSDGLAFLGTAQRALGGRSPTPINSDHGTLAPTDSEQPSSFANGRYEVKGLLGEGGKKQVYLAHDTLLDREVAFALIKTDRLDETSRNRIQREAQAMGRLGAHPHIVTIFDLGQESDQLYMVMELLGGGDVEGVIERAEDNRLSLEQTLEISQQVCRGLAFAHGRGIVHRDLKPGNVWLSDDGTAKIGDFGLAVDLDRSRLTADTMIVGTVAYLPPEQAMGGEVTPQSDLYCLGAMMYEMVAGRPPFVGDDPVAIITQHLNAQPVSPKFHRPDLPASLEALILHLLEKDPAKRPASAGEVAQSIASISLNEPPSHGETTFSTAAVDGYPYFRQNFVGRREEFRHAQIAFDNALSGRGSILMMTGEAGIGKTALWEQLATYTVVRGGRVLVGHCYQEDSLSIPYLPFVEALTSYVLALPPEAVAEDMGPGTAEVARIVAEVQQWVSVEPVPPNSPEEARWQLFRAVTTFLRNAASRQPLLLVLDDLHWADQDTVSLLTHLARNLSDARILVLGTYRDTERDRSPRIMTALADIRRAKGYDRLVLRGLDNDETHSMVEAIAGFQVRRDFADAVQEQTEGNPLFIQEVVRYLLEEAFESSKDSDKRPELRLNMTMNIPEGLREVISKRLSLLSQTSNNLLSVAAIVGREFSLETLQAVAEISEEEILTGLEEAVKMAVIEDRSRLGAVRFRFVHGLFRQTLYDNLFTPRRLRLHHQVAQALEAQYSTQLEDHAVELAEHLAQSDNPDDLAKAVTYSRIGAERAAAVYAYGQAAHLFEQALQSQEVLDPDDKRKQCVLRLDLGDALLLSGEPRRAVEDMAVTALQLAEELGDRELAFRACQIALWGLRRSGAGAVLATAGFRQWAERADRYATSGTIDRVQADIALSGAQVAAGQVAEGIAKIRDALELAKALDDPESIFWAAAVYLDLAQAPHRNEERLRLAGEFNQVDRSGVSMAVLSVFLMHNGSAHLSGGARDKAEAVWKELEDLANRSQDVYALLRPFRNQVILATLDGDLEGAAMKGHLMVEQADELGAHDFGRFFARQTTVRPLLYLGRGEEALTASLEEDRTASDNLSETSPQQALCLTHLSRRTEAQKVLDWHLNQGDFGRDRSETPVQTLVELLETSILLGEREAASLLADHLEPQAGLIAVPGVTCVARHLGGAELLAGNYQKALSYLRQSVEVASKVRFRPEIALSRLELAELLMDRYPEEHAEAQGHLDYAIEELHKMNMQPALQRALRRRGVLDA